MTDRKDRFTWKMGDLEITPPPTAAYAWTKADIADTAREAEMAGHTGRCKPGKPMKAVTARPKVRKPARFSRG